MKSKLRRALACATLPAALVAAGVWLPGASADQPATRNQREFVSDTFGGATRTAVTGQCVRTGMPDAGSAVAGCVEATVETAKAAPAQPAPEPAPEVVAAPDPVDIAPVPPMEPVAEEETL